MKFSAFIATAVVAIFGAGRAWLTPAQVAIVVNTLSEGSKMVAKSYMAARQIPAENLLEVKLDPMQRGWSESNYRQLIVEPLRKQLRDKHLDDKVTCLVLTYDIPLGIPAAGVSEADKAEFGAAEKRVRDFFGLIANAAGDYAAISPEATTTAPATRPAKVPTGQELRAAEEDVIRAADAAVKRIEKLPADLRGPAMQKFAEVHQKFLGPAGVAAAMIVSDSSAASADTRKRLEQMRQEVSDNNRKVAELAAAPSTAHTREEIFLLKLKTYGLVGGANQALEYVQLLNPVDSSACLDSELAMLWHDGYSKTRWLDNPYSLNRWPVSKAGKLPKVMMISRLDGLSPQAVITMINTTIKVEKEGLDGVAYFDARGIKTAGYEPYDRDLIQAADWLTKNSSMKVVLDKDEALLQAANCPDAAIYCGWYSLRNYKDSCQWKPGSVAFHVASWEMMTLHDEKEKGWVTNLLRRGVCGTLGATEEPFLTAFPRASQFFPLLLSGDFTQGEVYYLTNPWLSWRIGYVGDPLYNPFKAKPKVDPAKIKENVELRRAYEIMGALGMGPEGK